MKALIQHNFRTGLGDMFCDMSTYMTIALNLKKIGYEIHLYFSLCGNRYVKKNVFHEIFDKETISFFSSIEESFSPINEMKYKDFIYHSSGHDPQVPGIHRWDIFFDEPPKEPIQKFNYSSEYFYNFSTPLIKPKFNSEIFDRVNNFELKYGKEYSFLHVRVSDITQPKSYYIHLCEKLESYINDKNLKFYLGTNNDLIYLYFKNKKNIITYDFKNHSKIGNDVNAIDNSFDTDVLYDRLCDTLAEMILIKNSNSIHCYADSDLKSNFYSYAYSENNKINFIHIKDIIII
jgi:hypothetical protein